MEIINDDIQKTYKDIKEIGAGGGGTIYKAYHKRLKKDVVLKKIHSSIKGSIDTRIETDILKNLHHYYLPQVIDFLEVNEDVYTVMDYIPGKSFEQLIKEHTIFTKTQIMKYAEQICEAIAYLHEQKPPIMHGDIKPANIMLTPEDNICIIDFNISGFLAEGDMITVGYSAGYAAPEQCRAVDELRKSIINRNIQSGDDNIDDHTELLEIDEDDTMLLFDNNNDNKTKRRESITIDNSNIRIDLRADVFSIGATIYHLATGIRPSAQLDKNSPIGNVIEGYSDGFSTIVGKAMEAEPNNRFKNAAEMLKAIKNIHKYDKKYKSLVIKQEVAFITLVLFIGISVLLLFFGRERLQLENTQKYNEMVLELSNARTSGADDFEELFEKARDYMPEKLDAYYQKAILLAEQKRYKECRQFIIDYILNKSDFLAQSFADDTYYILANCYSEMEEYKEAIVYYQAAVEMNREVSQYYGDYAIALVYCGQIDNAEQVLKQGRERGMTSDYVYLVSAEIEAAKEKYEDAVSYFQECINTTQNQTMKLRAYILCDKALKKQGYTKEILEESIELLTKAETQVALSDQMLILERLAQDYIDMSGITGDNLYDEKAISTLDKIVQYGWDNYTTHINRAILYQRLGQLDTANDILNKLTNDEPDNYIAYKRLAILEIDIQGLKENAQRDYSQFVEYYTTTMELYEKANLGTNDVELQWLEQAMEKLISGGWVGGLSL